MIQLSQIKEKSVVAILEAKNFEELKVAALLLQKMIDDKSSSF